MPPGSLNKNSKGEDDTHLGVKDIAQKAFFLEMERTKSAGGVLDLFPPGVPISWYTEFIWKEFHSDFTRENQEARKSLQRLDPLWFHGSATKSLNASLYCHHWEIGWLLHSLVVRYGEIVGRILDLWDSIYKIHLHWCCALPPKAFRHLLFQVSPSEAKSDKGERHGFDREP